MDIWIFSHNSNLTTIALSAHTFICMTVIKTKLCHLLSSIIINCHHRHHNHAPATESQVSISSRNYTHNLYTIVNLIIGSSNSWNLVLCILSPWNVLVVLSHWSHWNLDPWPWQIFICLDIFLREITFSHPGQTEVLWELWWSLSSFVFFFEMSQSSQ